MRSVSAGFQDLLDLEVTTMAHCLKLIRRDGTTMGFTDHDRNIVYDSVTYYANTGCNISTISQTADLSVSNLEAGSALDDSRISSDDLLGGLYDGAEVYIFLIDYEDTAHTPIKLFRGWLGDVSAGEYGFTTEVRSLASALQQQIIELISPDCRTDLGDGRCGVTLATYTATGTVDSSSNLYTFVDAARGEADGYWDGGKLTWTSGDNDGLEMEIRHFEAATKEFTLAHPMPNDIVATDAYSITPGCSKTLAECRDRYDNVINFRGEPYLPGLTKLLQYPDAN